MATPIKMFKVTEEEMNSIDIVNGQLIFTIDTNKIYLDSNDQRDCYSRSNKKTFVQENEPVDAGNGDVWLIVDDFLNTSPEITNITLVPDGYYNGQEEKAWSKAPYMDEMDEGPDVKYYLKLLIQPEGKYKAEDFSVEVVNPLSEDFLTVVLRDQEDGSIRVEMTCGICPPGYFGADAPQTVKVKSNLYEVEGTYETNRSLQSLTY